LLCTANYKVVRCPSSGARHDLIACKKFVSTEGSRQVAIH